MFMMKKRPERGVTLVEILIVTLVLGILSATIMVSIGGTRPKSALSACEADFATTSLAATIFSEHNYQTTLTTAGLLGSSLGGPYLPSLPSNGTYYQFQIANGGIEVIPGSATTGTVFPIGTAPATACAAVAPGAPSAPTNMTASYSNSYTTAMNALSPTSYWPMNDASGSTISDVSGNSNTGNVSGTPTFGSSGPPPTSGKSISFPGTAYFSTTNIDNNPQSISISGWFNTTSSVSIMGFSNTQNPIAPTNYDRGLWVDTTGHLVGAVYSNYTTQEVVSPSVVNNGRWHFAVFTFGSGGENLYVDGVLAGSNSNGTSGQVYNGYWSLGYQYTTGWPDAPTSSFFTGSLSGVSIVPSVLTLAQVQSLYSIAKSSTSLTWSASTPNGSPVSQYTVTANYVSGGVSPTTNITACTTSTTSCTPSGLTSGDIYNFTVTATNAIGTSSSSSGSGNVVAP